MLDERNSKGMNAKRSSNEVRYIGERESGFSGKLWDILIPMATGGEEIRKDDDAFCASCNREGESFSDRWRGKLHMSNLNDLPRSVFLEK